MKRNNAYATGRITAYNESMLVNLEKKEGNGVERPISIRPLRGEEESAHELGDTSIHHAGIPSLTNQTENLQWRSITL